MKREKRNAETEFSHVEKINKKLKTLWFTNLTARGKLTVPRAWSLSGPGVHLYLQSETKGGALI